MRVNVLLTISIIAVLAVCIFIVADGHEDGNEREARVTYTVTFDGNGGTPAQQTKAVTPGQPYGDLPDASRDDQWEFQGWFTDPETGTEVTKDTIYETKGSSTLYAHWLYKYKIEYNLIYEGADNDPRNPGWYTKESGILELYPATLPETVFHGWYLDVDYTMGPLDKIDPSSGIGNITLYAKW